MSAAHTEGTMLAGYEVTADGRIFSHANWRGLGIRDLVHQPNEDGYPSVRLTINGKRVHYAVHKLVAMAHLDPRPSPAHEVRHLDGDKLNPNVANLAWGTRKENAEDRDRHGRTSKGESHSIAIKQGLPDAPWNKGLSGLPTSWNKGISPTDEHRSKLSSAMRGKPWTEARKAANAK